MEDKNSSKENLIPKEELIPSQSGSEAFGLGQNGAFNFGMIFNNEYNAPEHNAEKAYKKYCRSKEYLAQQFNTDLTKGLKNDDKSDLEMRDKKWGNNRLKPPEENSILKHIIEALSDKTLIVLMFAAVVSLIIGVLKDGLKGALEGVAITISIVLVCGISSFQNWKQKKEFLELDQKNKIKPVVLIRDGKAIPATNEDVLVGDIIEIAEGSIAVIDGFVIEGKAAFNEAAVTGENDDMKKSADFETIEKKYFTPFVLSGSSCVDGKVKVLVAAVGRNTFGGKNEEIVEANKRAKGAKKGDNEEDDTDEDINKSPLEIQLEDLSDNIGYFGMGMAIAIGVLIILKEISTDLYYGNPIISQKTLDVFVNAFIIR